MGYWWFWYSMQIINLERSMKIILFGGTSFLAVRRAFWIGYHSFYDSFYLILSKGEYRAYNSGPFFQQQLESGSSNSGTWPQDNKFNELRMRKFDPTYRYFQILLKWNLMKLSQKDTYLPYYLRNKLIINLLLNVVLGVYYLQQN